jgi:branched-chain amino acid transport system permease protein
MSFFLQLLINGISIGFLYGLSAMGFVMIFKSSRVLNFAHGELLAMGAFFFLALVTWAPYRRAPDLRHYADCRFGCNV